MHPKLRMRMYSSEPMTSYPLVEPWLEPPTPPSSIWSVPEKRTQSAFQAVGRTTCAHCQTTTTPLWRKINHVTTCNACGIYFKTHGIQRKPKLHVSTKHTPAKSTISSSNCFYHKRVPVKVLQDHQHTLTQLSAFVVLEGLVNHHVQSLNTTQ
jgi:hypothetical protein